MKKIFVLIILSLILCAITASCAPKTDLLSYRDTPYTFKADLELKATGDMHQITVTGDPENQKVSLSFDNSELLSGISFELCDNGILAHCGENTYPADGFVYVKEVFSLLTLDKNAFISAESTKVGQRSVNVLRFNGEMKITLESKSSLPLMFESELIKITVKR